MSSTPRSDGPVEPSGFELGQRAERVFVPDATYGVVRGVGADEFIDAGVRVVMANSYHLVNSPGLSRIKSLGGLKEMMGWSGPLMTDSGGFQAYSLIRENPGSGSITADGLTFINPKGNKIELTPERAIENQRRLGADVLFCLDDCTHVDDAPEEQLLSVERTLAWAARCREAFDKLPTGSGERPKLYGVIQGGRDEELRRRCAKGLLELDFDGFGFGGWPLDADGKLLIDVLALVRELIPADLPLHGLGIGHPMSVAACAELGYDTFDSSLPTRDARRGRLYRFRHGTPSLEGKWFEAVHLRDDQYLRQRRPIAESCPCVACRHYSLGYLNHLLRREDALYVRLATLHNLQFMRQLTDLLGPSSHR